MSRSVKSVSVASKSKSSDLSLQNITKNGSPPTAFLKDFFAGLSASDINLFTKAERDRMAASIWDLLTYRKPGEVAVRVYNPDVKKHGWAVDHTVIELVSDDMPFLVDSVTGVLQHAGYTVHLAVHPMMRIVRDARGKAVAYERDDGEVRLESLMHVQVDHCLDAAQLTAIETELRATLADVAAAVADWRVMRDRMTETARDLKAPPAGEGQEDIDETRAFLGWLCDDNFTFLGARDVVFETAGEDAKIKVVRGTGLGILRDDSLRMFGGLRDLDERRRPALRKYVRQNHALFITKTNAITRVHRVLPMDAVFVRSFDDRGRLIGERLFVGLFTAQTYAQTPRDIPYMRRKVEGVVRRMGFRSATHDGRALMHILNSYPHDELFQISEEELYRNALGILQLRERARAAMFPRVDPFGRYATCLIYVPRDRYDSALRGRIQAFLEAAYQGKAQAWDVRIDNGQLARAFVTLHLQPDAVIPDKDKLNEQLRDMCRTWTSRLRDSLVAAMGEARALILLRRYGEAFAMSYRDAISPDHAAQDIEVLEILRVAPRFVATLDERSRGRLTVKLFNPGQELALSATLPVLENMGLKIDYMAGPFGITVKDSAEIFAHKFVGRTSLPTTTDFRSVKPAFEEAFNRIWNGDAENDAFNALVLRAGLSWRQVALLRAFARYLRQLRIPYSHEMMAGTFVAYPELARQLVALFEARHDPAVKGDRGAVLHKIEASIAKELSGVENIEDDRIVRRYLNLVQASLRTNYFQKGADGQPKAYLSIKFDSRAVEFMPLPKPLYEIFVYSPAVEGVHLRGGKVARGGIRWSDRREDYRAEILGLMKAQMVKNTVIVPVGSKGGFIVKRPPAEADKFMAEGIACYKTLMRGLLDLTDNRVGTKVVPPKDVVRHDGDDPYLVVAADKGTAKFSDIANGLSQDYGFWLDDAFASGGSAGYDHKGMGITARGAWESAKRHFREIGKDIQTQDFTCIGVGDMSGDVFGNGMLLSTHTLLVGAFDHRHIFCDPSPDAAKSHAERRRLFDLPRSSWDDYDRKLISKGGGVFARSQKTIALTPEMKKAYGVAADSLPPAELIQAMLKAQVEMIYFGGIGTYVKSSGEATEAAGDRANDALRINGCDIRAKIVVEGANLGMTQAARIEYALAGGRLNTDAIDNSAGVDTSDHEVNIKILLSRAMARGQMTIAARNKLLASMTDEVARLVLRDNYLQTAAVSLDLATAGEALAGHVRCLHFLEKEGLLNRKVETLPDDAILAERQKAGQGLTRPELAVFMAYAKIWLYQSLLETDLPDEPFLAADIEAYFPAKLRKDFTRDIQQHGLRREIAATCLVNDAVNHAGPQAVLSLAERVGIDRAIRTYLLARDALGLSALWAGIEALDNKVAASVQTGLSLSVRTALTQAMEALAADIPQTESLSRRASVLNNGLAAVAAWVRSYGDNLDDNMTRTVRAAVSAGVPEKMAFDVAVLPKLVTAAGIIDLAADSKCAVGDLAALFFGVEQRLDLAWMRHAVAGTAQNHAQREALAKLLSGLDAHHRRLTAALAMDNKGRGRKTVPELLTAWGACNAEALRAYDSLIAEARTNGNCDLSVLLLANERLSGLRGAYGQ